MRRPFWALFMSGGCNHSVGEIQVGKRRQREHLRAILGEAAIAYLAIAEMAFDDPEHVLILGGAKSRFCYFLRPSPTCPSCGKVGCGPIQWEM